MSTLEPVKIPVSLHAIQYGSGGITKDNIAILMPVPFYCFVILVEAIHIVITFLKRIYKSLNYRLENIDVLSLERK